jgi:hypothetical protein
MYNPSMYPFSFVLFSKGNKADHHGMGLPFYDFQYPTKINLPLLDL